MSDKRRYGFSGFVGWFRELPRQVQVGGIVLVVIVTILTLLPPSLFHSFNCATRGIPQNYRSSNGYFIDNQVILVGPEGDVETVIGLLTPVPVTPTETPGPIFTPAATQTPIILAVTATSGAPVPTETSEAPNQAVLTFIEGCDLSYLNTRKAADSDTPVENRQLVMRLYEIKAGTATIPTLIGQINRIAGGDNPDKRVYNVSVDPNYLTRLADSTTDPCALPGDGGGNGGRPFGEPGADNTAYDPIAAKAAFEAQWALQRINLPSGFTGRGVRVGIFDTDPYRFRIPFYKHIGEASPSPMWIKNSDAGGNTVMSNHGLFVASLIHRVAPKSRIQLVRVLNDDGCGELWVLNKGLESYKSWKSAWSTRLNKTVINMSLGIHVPDESSDKELTALQREELGTLQSLIDTANEMGAIIVASAGNDSTVTVSGSARIPVIKPMQVPASYLNVIGVAATRPDGTRSCYSDNGDVAAPGGDGGPKDERQPDGTVKRIPCAPRADTWDQAPGPDGGPVCTRPETCPYVVIGLGQTRYGPRYMYWSGTSFAAPLVSGMAALAYQTWNHDQVECIVYKGRVPSLTVPAPTDPLGVGAIDISRDLSATAVTSALATCP